MYKAFIGRHLAAALLRDFPQERKNKDDSSDKILECSGCSCIPT